MSVSRLAKVPQPLTGRQNTDFKVINKRLNLEMDLPNHQTSNLPSMDDEGDKQGRRRHSRGFSKTIQLKQKTMEPTAAADPKWTPDQLYSHYSQCMKLSQENKINHKNAFELHLIDHMQKFIQKDGTTNFLVAGGTIYAGAKIYASRVDALSTILNRLILSLASGGKEDDEEPKEDGGDIGDDNLGPGVKPKTRKKKKNCQVLETQETNLRVVSIPQMCLANLIQRREGRSVDAANCSFLATNQYKPCKDEVGIKYVEESNDRVLQHDHDPNSLPEDENTPNNSKGNLFTQLLQANYLEDLNKADKKKLKNVDSLIDFDFDSLNSTSYQSDDIPEPPENPFSEDLEAAAIDRVEEGNNSHEVAPHISDDDMDFGCTPADDEDDLPPIVNIQPVLGDNTMPIPSASFQAITTDALDPARLVALKPGEYSFFSRDALPSYDGPDNWLKMKNAQAAALKKAEEKSLTTESTKADGPPVKKRKAAMKTGVELKLTRISSPITKATQKLTAAKKDQMRDNKPNLVTLEKCEISKADLIRAMQVRVYIRPLELQFSDFGQVEQDDLSEAINHANTDFCPPVVVDNIHDDDEDPNHYDDHDDDDDREGLIFNPSTTEQGENKETEYENMLEGDHLVEGPKKVEAMAKFNFGNLNKKMDVKKLKEALWRDLREKVTEKKNKKKTTEINGTEEMHQEMNCEENNKSNEEPRIENKGANTSDDELLFSQTYSSLPDKLSGGMRESLSVPIAFTCLLHLANEKQLEIQSLPSLTDVIIKLPSDVKASVDTDKNK